jgi:hypothetical protein
MRNVTLAVLTVLVVLLLAAGGVAASGSNATTSNNTASDHTRVSENASGAEWATWMKQHMTEHMGANATAQMQERMGMSYKEMGEHMASRQNGSMMNGQMMDGMMSMRSRMDGSAMNGMGNESRAGGMMSGTGSGMGC